MPGPPKMRLPYAPNQLRLVSGGVDHSTGDKHTDDIASTRPTFIRGVRYSTEQWRNCLQQENNEFLEHDTFVSRYALNNEAAEIKPATNSTTAFYWGDGPIAAGATLAENEFHLLSSSVEDLVIAEGVDCAVLAITPKFQVRYRALAHAAQLGEIRLVTASRFVTDEKGEQHRLLDTEPAGAPVLFREDGDDNSPVLQRSDWQFQNTEKNYAFDYCIAQPLKRTVQGRQVKTVTVLEQYTSYFMQRALTADPNNAIWVPACAPVLWGWSLRVEPENDAWVITRRKLVPPVVGSDGLELPHWLDSTLEYKFSSF